MGQPQLRKVFAMEAEDRLHSIETALLQLEREPEDREAINTIFRAAHTIKGSAGVVGLDSLSKFMHTVETFLEQFRSGASKVTPEFIKLMLSCHDHVQTWLNATMESEDNSEVSPDPQWDQACQTLLAQFHNHAQGDSATVAERRDAPAKVASQKSPVSDKLTKAFRVDSAQTLHQFSQALEHLHTGSKEALAQLYQACLSLRTAAEQIGFGAFQELARELEQCLSRCKKQDGLPPAEVLVLLDEAHAHLQSLRRYAVDNPGTYRDGIEPLLQDQIDELCASLQALPETLGATRAAASGGEVVATATPVQAELTDEAAEAENWHISLRFDQEVLTNGIEPLETLRYLAQMGSIVHLITLHDRMPPPGEMNPEACYLGFELGFKTHLNKAEIDSLFELVHEFCEVRIVPPHSKISHYIKLIQELPEDLMQLGEILIKSGTLTRRELEQGLALQRATPTGAPAAAGYPESHRIGEILVDHGVVPQDVVNAAVSKQKQVQEAKLSRQRSLHVDAAKLDQLIDLVGELVTTNASMKLLSTEINEDRLKKLAAQMSRLVEDIRNHSLGMRMIPIGDTFNRFQRLVRDLSQNLGKQVDLQLSGTETELDKSMVEKIADPLLHLVRNSIDHGIETEQERIAAGKPPVGILQLNAYHDSGSVIIEVADDGHGLDCDKIRETAVRKGIIKADQEVSEQELYQLIFAPGFSTAEQVTELSGRGVGLDVVKRNISLLNGSININSEPGGGSLFELCLPLTLAIIDGFLLRVGASSFAVPLDRVVRCVKYTEAYQQEARSGYINLQGKALPLLPLHELMNIPEDSASQRNIVVVRHGNSHAGLVVDELLGEFQAVVKPLGKLFERMVGVSGATILGNGNVALILDVSGLIKKYSKRVRAHPQQAALLGLPI